MGETIYKGNINKNKGIVMGNAYAPVKDGIKIIGAMTTVTVPNIPCSWLWLIRPSIEVLWRYPA
jgi:hypothetical protein